jgi:prolyl-tRNA synthetase
VGVVIPPKLAPVQAVIVPIYRTDTERAAVLEVSETAAAELRRVGIRVQVDLRDGMKPGAKYYEHEGRGVPLRLEVGPRDVGQGQVTAARRTGGKAPLPLNGLVAEAQALLALIQRELLEAARVRREQHSHRGLSKDDFLSLMDGEGGFVYAGFCGSGTCEQEIKERTKATVRVLPDEEFRSPTAPSRCLWCGAAATSEAVWAKAY